MPKTVLIVDDEPTQRRLLTAMVEKEGFIAQAVESGEKAIEVATDPKAKVDVVLLDMMMPGMNGQETLETLKPKRPDLPVIVLTGQAGHQPVVDAMRAGASDFFVKPASPERIAVGLRNAMKMRQMTGEVTRLKKTAQGELSFNDMIATAPAMAQVVSLGQRAAKSNIPVLITGESGVGKELFARAIQGASNRSGAPFVTVNCGAIPENLVESVLFGHKKGSFTGATSDHQGKFKEADGGTLFLDEVGELPLDMQVKLLRALQEGEIDPVGAKSPLKVDVRIVSATNRDLAAQVRDGVFREDLFYRLNVFPIEVPPLRNRREDIPAMVEHFIARFNVQEGRTIKGCRPDTMQVLQNFDWPGNVRQLENAVFRAVILAEDDVITPDDFPHLPMTGTSPAAPVSPQGERDPRQTENAAPVSPHQNTAATALSPSHVSTDPNAELTSHASGRNAAETTRRENSAATALSPFHASKEPNTNAPARPGSDAAGTTKTEHPAPQPFTANTGSPELGTPEFATTGAGHIKAFPVELLDDAGHLRPLDQIERDLIEYAIEAYSGHMSEVARRLGIGRSTLYRKVREHELDVGQARTTG